MLSTLLTFIIILGLLVFVHELGHFVVARRSGVKVDEFGFGLPPRMFGVYRDQTTGAWKPAGPKTVAAETIYSLNWVPLGGFVKIKGEQGESAEDQDSFVHKSIGTRIGILSAGVSMNIFLAIILLSIGFMIGLPRELDDSVNLRYARVSNATIYVTDVVKDFPAAKAGMKVGDTIQSIDDQTFADVAALQKYVNAKKGQALKTTIERNHQALSFTVTPQVYTATGEIIIGVQLSKMATVSYPWYIAIWEGIKTTLFLMKEIILAFYSLLKNLLVSHHVAVDLSGPVGIAVLTGEVARMGFIYILQFAALLSINLAIINFLPIPALDGGRVMFLIIEKIRGKAINAKAEALIHNIGLYLLFLLVIIITFNDIHRFSDKFVNAWHALTGRF